MNTITNLPPDPEGQNDDRAASADVAIKAFARDTRMDTANEEGRTIVADLLADVMHWCDRNDVAFADVLETGYQHYAEETRAD
jgi:hypothetical protein